MSFERDVAELLDIMRRRKWEFHYFGGTTSPHTLGAVLKRAGYADVFVLRDDNDNGAVAYRAALEPGLDVFEPEQVVWVYAGSPVWTLRAVLTLAEPTETSAPHTPMPAPAACRMRPADRGLPMAIRPGQAGGPPDPQVRRAGC